MNKLARFLLTGFALSVITIMLSLAFSQSSARKMPKHSAGNPVKVALAR